MNITPSQRTRNHYSDLGFVLGTVERYISPGGQGGFRKDLFGIIDYIAISKNRIVGLQSTGTAFSEHHKKITTVGKRMAIAWIESGAELHLVGWREVAGVIQPRIKIYTLADFDSDPEPTPPKRPTRRREAF